MAREASRAVENGKLKNVRSSSALKAARVQSPGEEEVKGLGENGISAMSLDPIEVMRSMMLAKRDKGKQRDESSSAGSLSDSEDDDDPEGGSESESEASAAGNGINGDGENESEAESSSSAVRRARKRSRSSATSVENPQTARKPTMQDSDQSLSRVRPRSQPDASTNNGAQNHDPFETQKISAPTSFASLGLSQPLILALQSISIKQPTEIQSACVAPILSGRDCIGGAKTGSGKTLAFALPIVERIARDPYGIWAVVLTPTRELAYQLAEQFIVVSKPLGLSVATVVGGMDMMAQAAELEKRPHIVVATPGRLCDLLRSDPAGSGKLSRVKTLVLDEADRLLTPTFAPDLGYLFSQMPPSRQTCLFTATISDAIMALAKKEPAKGKEKPFVYRIESDTMTVAGLKQKYLFIPSQIRDPYLVYLLHHSPTDIDTALRANPKPAKSANPNKRRRARSPSESDQEESFIPSTIIFTQRCATAHLLHLLLTQLDIPSVPLHSHLTQPQRLESLARFRAREVPILVTTDVGSRGLDIPEVAMVVNWDCPRRSDDYVHRVGRTARAGKGGVAVTIVTEKDVDLVQGIEEEIGVKMTELQLPEGEVLAQLNAVSLARRMATMEMHDTGFGERQATNKAKAIRRAKRDKAKAKA